MSRKKKRAIQAANLELVKTDIDTRAKGISYRKTFHIKDLKNVSPMTENQKKSFMKYNMNFNLIMHGCAGTGKTFLGMFFGLRDVLDENSNYKKLIIVRSVVPSRDMGFLPGTEEEKIAVYEEPYSTICNSLFTYSKSYDNLKKSGYVQFTSTSFQRGITFDDSIVLIDEAQNMTDQEISTVMTRIGNNTKVIICGDTNQKDLKNSGFDKNIKIFNEMQSIVDVKFQVDDIVRSDFVREYIIARENID
jgi:phosphate starvation-inducible protein PhoH and related proteins